MAKTYRVTTSTRLANLFVKALVRAGLGAKGTYLLTVRGRKSGQLRSTPVTLLEEEGQRWLVALYGEVNWVQNARAAGRVTFSRGGRSETVSILGNFAPPSAARDIFARLLSYIWHRLSFYFNSEGAGWPISSKALSKSKQIKAR